MDPSRPSTSSSAKRYDDKLDPFNENFDADLLLASLQRSPKSDDLEFDCLDEYEDFLMSSQPELATRLVEVDEEETQKIAAAERLLKGKKRREQRLAEVVRKGNEIRKAAIEAEGGKVEFEERSIFDKKRERTKKNKDVWTRMETMEGPMSRLKEFRNRQTPIRIVLRGDSQVNRILTGFVQAFDKHWNIILRNVRELYLPANRLGKDQSLKGTMPSAIKYDLSEQKWPYATTESKRFVLERRCPFLMVLGDNVVSINNPAAPKVRVIPE